MSAPRDPSSLSITDNRTGKTYEIPVREGAVPATAFAKVASDGEGLRVFDSAYQNTAVVRSKICYIDGERGVLEYRGYGIEELAEKSTFLEVAYLLIYGELPTKVRCGCLAARDAHRHRPKSGAAR